MRRLRLSSLVAFGLGLLVTGSAAADEGEVYLDLWIMPQVGVLTNQKAGAVLPTDRNASITFLPRAGLGARWGFTNELHAGLALDAAFFPNVPAANASIDGFEGTLFANHGALSLPIFVSYRFDSGYDYTGLLEVGVGPTVAWWQNTGFGDPKIPDAQGRPSALPVSLTDDLHVGGTARVNLAFEARLLDLIVVAVGPSFAVAWAGGLQLEVGLLLRPSIAFGAGPL